MPQPEAWEELEPSRTILFLGSGFSAGAMNKNDENFLTASALAVRLRKTLGYDPEDYIPLADIADDFIPEHSELLYNTLYPLMVTKEITSDQRELLERPWRRIYTTNYDDVCEFGFQQLGKEPQSLSFKDSVQKPKGGRPQIVHLHGYIHRCDGKNIDNELVLSKRSYVRQQAIPQPWFDQFRNDIRFAAAVVFVGYSLADIPINSLLLAGDDIREKTSFVIRGNHDARYERQVSRYGTIRPIALSGLVNHLRDLSQRPKPPASSSFDAFVEMNPGRDRKALDPPTTVEVRNLLVMGKFLQRPAAATFGEPRYVIPREEKIDQGISAFGRAKTLLVHSRRGNGKSVFCELLNIALSEKGYRCIRTRSDPRLTENDLRLLKSTQRIVIFCRTPDDAIAVMEQIGEPRSDMHFVVEISTSIAGVRANVVNQHLQKPVERIDLNVLTDQDKEDFGNILDLAGIRPRNFQTLVGPCREMRDLILKLFEDAHIRNMVLEVAHPLLNNPALRRAIIESFALKSLEVSLSPNMARAVSWADPLEAIEAAENELMPAIEDLFHLDDSRVEPWSTVVAEFLLSEIVDPAEVIEWAIRVATVAGQIKQQEVEQGSFSYRFREANHLLGKIMQISALRRLLGSGHDQEKHLRNAFEHWRHVDVINCEPLFWLQFSILVMGENPLYADLLLARDYLDTAYQRAEMLDSFKTYQLDTHALRLMFRIESHPDHPKEPFSRAEEMAQLLERFREMLSDGSHRSFVLKVLPMAEEFVNARLGDIASADRKRLAQLLEECVTRLGSLPENVRLYENCSEAEFSLKRALHKLQVGPLA